MKKQALFLLLGGVLLTFPALPALADGVPTNAMPMSSVLEKLQMGGYSIIKEIKFDGGQYEAKAISSQGRIDKLDINPQTGEIINAPKKTQTSITALEVAKKVEAAGYHNIYKLEAERNNEYHVKALDKNGKKVKLKVDTTNGKISEKWFD